jgi:hypothetical protein
MMHPEIEQFMAAERVEMLRRDARRPEREAAQTREDLARIELRLCRVSDNDALAELAELSERDVPAGSFVLAFVDGRLVAAHSLDGGCVLADPFARTAHLRGLLKLRAEQIQKPTPSRRFGILRRATA